MGLITLRSSGVCFPSGSGGVHGGIGDPMLLGRTGVVGAESGNQAQSLLPCLNFVIENHTISM